MYHVKIDLILKIIVTMGEINLNLIHNRIHHILIHKWVTIDLMGILNKNIQILIQIRGNTNINNNSNY